MTLAYVVQQLPDITNGLSAYRDRAKADAEAARLRTLYPPETGATITVMEIDEDDARSMFGPMPIRG